jgi:hypothetical protein
MSSANSCKKTIEGETRPSGGLKPNLLPVSHVGEPDPPRTGRVDGTMFLVQAREASGRIQTWASE